MDVYFFMVVWALGFTLIVVVPAYALLLALANVAYRVASGRFFRWTSWRTFLPFLVLSLGVWGFVLYAFTRPNAFAITH
ncbi:MAG: hypothetical protein ACJ74T_21055 [Pyrinomonadaceae bacterium]